MSQWEMVKLGEIFKITSGGTPSKKIFEYYENGTIPWIKTGDLKNKYISEDVEKITQKGIENSSAKIFPQNTVLIAMYGATIGACSILPFEATTNQACAAFLPHENVSHEFLFYYLLSQKQNFIKLGVGGAQPNISATILKNIYFPIPPFEIQDKIAHTLDTVSDLIKMYKEQLEQLDLLVKSQFVEMFGDPIINSKQLPVKSLGEICNMKAGKGIKAIDIFEIFEEGMYP